MKTERNVEEFFQDIFERHRAAFLRMSLFSSAKLQCYFEIHIFLVGGEFVRPL